MPEGYLAQLEGLIDDLHKRKQLALGFQREEREERLQQILRDIQTEQLGISRERFGLERLKAGRETAAEEERRGLFPEPPSFEGILAPERGQPVPPGPAMSESALRVRRGARAGAFTPEATGDILALGEEGFVEGKRAGLLKSRVEASRGLSDLDDVIVARAAKREYVDYARAKFGDATADALAANFDKFSDETLMMMTNVFPGELRDIMLIKGGLMQAAKEKDPAARFSLLAKVDENIMNAMKSLEALKDPKDRAFMMERINASVSLRDQVAGMSGVAGGPGTTLRPGAPPIFFGKAGTELAPPSMRFGPPPLEPQVARQPGNEDHNKVVQRLMRETDPLAAFQRVRGRLQAEGFDTDLIEERLVTSIRNAPPDIAEFVFGERPEAPGGTP